MKEREKVLWSSCDVSVALLVDHQAGKLEICGSNPSLNTNFSLNKASPLFMHS